MRDLSDLIRRNHSCVKTSTGFSSVVVVYVSVDLRWVSSYQSVRTELRIDKTMTQYFLCTEVRDSESREGIYYNFYYIRRIKTVLLLYYVKVVNKNQIEHEVTGEGKV